MNRDEEILKFWEKEDVFHKSIENRKDSPYFSFFDGPPFATGKPHYGHVLATTIKDAVLRYWTMKGYQVPRRVGWDCHGLPVENLIERELNIKSKKEIEEMGIEKFNDACRSSVFACVDDFQKTLKRVGRWADYSNAYATLDNNYIESVWWVLKQLWNEKLVSRNYRVSPYCPRCSTTLSNFEVNQGYKEVKDRSAYVKFKIKEGKLKGSYLLVWTTTPWTLPGNIALAVSNDLEYSHIKGAEGEEYILASPRLSVIEGEYEVLSKMKGKDLVGLEYEPLFDYLQKEKVEGIEKAYRVFAGDFVSSEDGTGIVHINPMHGEDDFNVAREHGLPFYHTVDNAGKFKPFVIDFQGKFVKDADREIIDYLNQRGLFYKDELVTHEYPFCWRCDSPLLYYAIESWYVLVTELKDKLLKNNEEIHWVPEHIKEGRFGKWLEGAKDWDISRSRFWGAPIPIWECPDCHERVCIGSVKELKEMATADYDLKDLHRPYIDAVKLKCPKCGHEMERTPEVFDCWFESGSMPYAQWHYPFENKELVEKIYPADFIAEGLDQTRGWFYTLHVLATALTKKDIGLGKNHPAFRNVIVNGLVLDDRGRKLSKKLKNYPDPSEVFDSFGADALRYFLLASTSIGEDYRFSKDKVKEYWRKIISALENCFVFFETYKGAKHDGKVPQSDNLLDRWIVGKTEELNRDVVKWMDKYELTRAARLFTDYIDDLSNWYIRRSRRRFQKPESGEERDEATQTLYYALFKLCQLLAPFTPFITEEIYLKLKQDGPISVHLCDYPESNDKLIDEKLNLQMAEAREIVNLALAERSKIGIKVRQPLLALKVKLSKTGLEKAAGILDLVKDEVNVKEIVFDNSLSAPVELDQTMTPELKEEGDLREVVRQIQQMRKDAGFKPEDRIAIGYQKLEFFDKILIKRKEELLREVLADDIFTPEAEEQFDLSREADINGEKIFLGIKKKK